MKWNPPLKPHNLKPEGTAGDCQVGGSKVIGFPLVFFKATNPKIVESKTTAKLTFSSTGETSSSPNICGFAMSLPHDSKLLQTCKPHTRLYTFCVSLLILGRTNSTTNPKFLARGKMWSPWMSEGAEPKRRRCQCYRIPGNHVKSTVLNSHCHQDRAPPIYSYRLVPFVSPKHPAKLDAYKASYSHRARPSRRRFPPQST